MGPIWRWSGGAIPLSVKRVQQALTRRFCATGLHKTTAAGTGRAFTAKRAYISTNPPPQPNISPQGVCRLMSIGC
jgi:hypothetical protein